MNVPLLIFSQENPSELELTKEEVMPSVLDMQSTCLDMSRSTIGGRLPHSGCSSVLLKPQTLRHTLKQLRWNSLQKIVITLSSQMSPTTQVQMLTLKRI
jgi:hypothetical protein